MKKHSILLVDDEEIILKTLGLDLKDEGYEVTLASSGEEAVGKLSKTSYDLIITDLMMDGIDGIEVLKLAKKKDTETMVLILTAYGSLPSAISALRLGAADYILKPCSKSEMLTRVSDCLEKLEFKKKAIPFENILPVDNRTPFLQRIANNGWKKRLMVYSHDTFGLGNIRRMLSICQSLINSYPDISILFISGSPMIHSFRIPDRLDYIKLPCLSRNERENFSAKYLKTEISEIMKLRSDLILAAITGFRPGLVLIDKKPYGIKNELQGAMAYLKTHMPETKLVLILRDILDTPEETIRVWKKNRYFEAIQSFYSLVLILGQSEVFDASKEYRFPDFISQKVKFCGYIKRDAGEKSLTTTRKELKLHHEEKLILVTPGGGEDGSRLLETYLSGLDYMPVNLNIKSLIICGPSMSKIERKQLCHTATKYPNVTMFEFSNDILSYMDAADIVVTMGGYNTICEILSLKKRAIVVPRTKPVEEQWIRAERMTRLDLFQVIHPDKLTPQGLMQTIVKELNSKTDIPSPFQKLDLDALPRMTKYVSDLL